MTTGPTISITQSRPVKITKFRYQSDRAQLNKHIQSDIGVIVSVLERRYKFEYELLEYLATDDHTTFQEFVEMSYSLIEHLNGYGLIKEDNGNYYFRINAAKEYIKNRGRVQKALLTKEEKWQQVTAQRNILEEKLRRVVKLTLKLNFKPIEQKNVFLEIISPPSRQQKLSNLSFDQIFVSSQSEIYFDDLKKVILKNWSIFSQIFNNDKEHFKNYMEYVNQHRIDAHAKDIDEETLGILLMSLQWLRRHIDKFLA